MSLAEQIFVNETFLWDLTENKTITFGPVCLSSWGAKPEETFANITDRTYITDNIENSEVKISFKANTFIEDDLVCFSFPPEIQLNLYYSLVIYYDVESNNEQARTDVAAIMYTQNIQDSRVLSLISQADNRVYLDLRSLPLKAHLLTHMSPNEVRFSSTNAFTYAPVYHRHITKPSHTEETEDFDSTSVLPNAYTDSLAIAATIGDPDNKELDIEDQTDHIQCEGFISSTYLPSNKDSVTFYRNVVGCAYEWANSRLCTEDLVDANNIVTIDAVSINIDGD